MPVIRQDDLPRDPLAPQILLLWKRKWFIAGVALAAAIITYVSLLFVNSSYRVTAEIFVNRLPSVPQGEIPNPDTVSSLLKSQMVIGQVRDEFVKKFNVEPPRIERFAKAFSVKSTVLQDTTVRKELSPVLQLEVESQGAEETRFIMESWIRNFIRIHGNYTVDEAIVKRDAYLAENRRLEQQILELQAQEMVLEAKLPLIRKMFAEKLDQLSPARMRMEPTQDKSEGSIVQFFVQPPRLAPGLLERLSELELDVKTGTLPSTGALEMLALQSSINENQTSISAIEKEYAATLTEISRLQREAGLLLETREAINDAITRFTVAAAVYRESADGLPAGGDIRALSMPVLPEARVWPKRTIAAGVVAIVAAILAAFFVVGQQYIRNLRDRDTAA